MLITRSDDGYFGLRQSLSKLLHVIVRTGSLPEVEKVDRDEGFISRQIPCAHRTQEIHRSCSDMYLLGSGRWASAV